MKRSITLLLSVLMLFSFASCKGESAPRAESLASGSSSSAFALQSASSAAASTTDVSTTAESTTDVSTTDVSTTAVSTTAESTTAESTTAESTTAEKTTEKKTEAETRKDEPEAGGETSPVCFVTIDCRSLKSNLSSLKKGKKAFVPQSGYILKEAAVAFEPGESAFDALKRACKENVCTDSCEYCKKGGIQLEFSFTPAYKSYYVEGIHQLYEKDCGSFSGWMFSVNGEFADVSSSEYKLKNGDKVTFAYTVSMGDDLTGAF